MYQMLIQVACCCCCCVVINFHSCPHFIQVEAHFTVDRIAILGIGVDHGDLLQDVSGYFDSSRSKPSTPVASLPSKFFGGSDLRRDDGSGSVVAGLVASAAPKTASEAVAFKVLAKLLGK